MTQISHSWVYIWKMKTLIQKDTCTPIVIAGSFTVAKTKNWSKCPSSDARLKKMWYIYVHIYYSFITKWNIVIFSNMDRSREYYTRSPGGTSGKESACQCRRCKRCTFNPWVREDSLEKEMAIQYSCLENSMDRGAWWAIVCGIAKSQTWVSSWAHTENIIIS